MPGVLVRMCKEVAVAYLWFLPPLRLREENHVVFQLEPRTNGKKVIINSFKRIASFGT